MSLLDPDQLATIVAAAIKSATAPLVARIAQLETRGMTPGPSGVKGPIGPKGEPGPAGSSISAGAGAPTFQGASGDVFVDATTGDVYQWR